MEKIVIEIPEEIRQVMINNVQLSLDQQSIMDSYIRHAIITSTPLPKGHGRLIDSDALIDTLGCSDRDIYCKQTIEEAETIIEADNARK